VGNFLISLLASLLGGIILLLGVSALSIRARWILTAILGRALGIDIDFVYANKNQVASDLRNELARSRDIAIFVGRGNEFQRDTFAPIFRIGTDIYQPIIRILLPKTSLNPNEYDWTAQRERELAEFDHAFGNRLLHRQIEANIEFLRQHVKRGAVALRRYNYPQIGRIIATERFLYFTPYERARYSRDARVYKFRRGGDIYESYMRLFEQIWESAESTEYGNEGR
jgi:hypothetical protein